MPVDIGQRSSAAVPRKGSTRSCRRKEVVFRPSGPIEDQDSTLVPEYNSVTSRRSTRSRSSSRLRGGPHDLALTCEIPEYPSTSLSQEDAADIGENDPHFIVGENNDNSEEDTLVASSSSQVVLSDDPDSVVSGGVSHGNGKMNEGSSLEAEDGQIAMEQVDKSTAGLKNQRASTKDAGRPEEPADSWKDCFQGADDGLSEKRSLSRRDIPTFVPLNDNEPLPAHACRSSVNVRPTHRVTVKDSNTVVGRKSTRSVEASKGKKIFPCYAEWCCC